MNINFRFNYFKVVFLLSLFFLLNFNLFGQNHKPIPVCNQHIQVSMDINGLAEIDGITIDENSYDPDDEPIYFKVLRVNDSLQYDGGCIDLNDDDNPSTSQIDVWFDDNMIFCLEDHNKPVVTILRVFDKNPGNGPVNPDRMEINGDLYSRFNDCFTIVTAVNKLGYKPFASCDQYKQVSINAQGEAKINAKSFDGGSFNLSGDSVYFKILRINDSLKYDGGCIGLNGDDNPVTSEIEAWYDDDVFYCCEDAKKNVFMRLRVFNKDPGSGPVDPSRMEKNGDLYNSYNGCWSQVTVENKIPPTILCHDINITCSESLDPDKNPSIKPDVSSVCDYTLDYKDKREHGICSAEILRTWTIITNSNSKSASCDQKIVIPDTVAYFDPCSILFPKDQHVNCVEGVSNILPTWKSGSCNVISGEILHEDTFTQVGDACLKIVREWVIIDWCVYTPNTGAENNIDEIVGRKLNCENLVEDGYYRYTQVIKINDNLAPSITFLDNFTTTTNNIIHINAIGDDSCSVENKFQWKYIINNAETSDIIQFSYNYFPTPNSGIKGDKNKDDLDKTKIGKLVILNLLPEGKYQVAWTVTDKCGNSTTSNQYFKVKKGNDCIDNIAPIAILVDNSTIVMNNGYSDVKAKTFDKGRCPIGSLASFDDITPRSGLYFTFSEFIPKLWDNPLLWSEQLSEYGKYYFDPNSGNISTEELYKKGIADAWLPNYKTSQRRYICGGSCNHNELKIYVWDKFAYNNNLDFNNFSFGTVKIEIKNCSNNIDNTPPVPIVVNIATVLMSNDAVELKAKTFDKGGCDFGCLSSYDNLTPKEGLFFTYSEYIPRLWENPTNWSNQLSKYGKYYFDPNSGNISTKELYEKGKADAWLPKSKTSQRKYFCGSLPGNEIKLKIYVWDQFAYNTVVDFNNFDYAVVKVKFNNCTGGILNTDKVNNKVELYQNNPNPFISTTQIKFDLPNDSKYKFTIFDTNGKIIFTETNKGIKGENRIEINSNKIESGSGIYLYKLETDGFTSVKKMMKL